jgi:hypothetical protein
MAVGLFVRVLDAGRILIDVLQDALFDSVSVCGGDAACQVALVKERYLDPEGLRTSVMLTARRP